MKVSKSFPHACPVCKGRGEITEELAQHEAVVKYDLGDRKIYSCHVCQGQCMIWEYRDEEADEPVLPTTILPQVQLPQIQIQPSILNPMQPNMQPFVQGPISVGDPPWATTWSVSNSNQLKMDNGKK